MKSGRWQARESAELVRSESISPLRGVFGRLLIAYLGILLVTVGILVLVLSRLVSSFFYDQREQVLNDRAQQVSEFVVGVQQGSLAPTELRRILVLMERNEQLAIAIVDTNGLPTLDPRANAPRLVGSYIQTTLPTILKGQRVTDRQEAPRRGDLGFMIVGVPITSGQQVLGAVYAATSVHAIRSTPQAVFRLMWRVILVVALLAAVVIYVVSRRIADPLEEVSRGALALARGDFSHRVPVRTHDEVGLVARSFNRMATQLEQVEQMRRDFIANVSHELRTPLTSLRGFIQGVRDGAIPHDEAPRYLGLALNELERLNRLVNELLDLASLESGRFQLQQEPRDAFELARRALVKLEPVMSDRELSVNVDLPTAPGYALLDTDRFEQIMLNLLANAVRFTPPGGTVSLLGHTTKEALTLVVQDTGPGIPPEDLPHIWDRFYKVDRSRRSSGVSGAAPGGGTGLGLTITRHLVEAHQGTIRVESELGKGTSFILTFPRVDSTP